MILRFLSILLLIAIGILIGYLVFTGNRLQEFQGGIRCEEINALPCLVFYLP